MATRFPYISHPLWPRLCLNFISFGTQNADHLYRLADELKSSNELSNNVQVLASKTPIILFDSFATVQETQDLLQAAEQEGWEGSFTVRGPLASVLGFKGWEVDANKTENQDSLQSLQNVHRNPVQSRLRRSSVILPFGRYPAVESILHRAASLVGVPPAHCEHFSLVRYREGECFQLHNDWFPNEAFQNQIWGQRICTVLVYLNTLKCCQGGETIFPNLNLSVTPRCGAALVWANIVEDLGSKNTPQSNIISDGSVVHGSEPLSADTEKYVVNLFFREKPVLMHWLEAFLVPFSSPLTFAIVVAMSSSLIVRTFLKLGNARGT